MRRHSGGAHLEVSGAHAIAGYLARSRLPGFDATLDIRLARLAGALAAELSGCRWCIDRSSHEARLAGLSPELLNQLERYSGSALLNERERAALALVDVIGRSRMRECGDVVLQRARRYFTESELAELTAIAAEHHCVESFNPSRL